MKKFAVLCGVIIFLSTNLGFAELSPSIKSIINMRIESLESKVANYPKIKQQRLFNSINILLSKRRNEKNSELIDYILISLKKKKLATYQGISDIKSHNSLILRFTKGGNHLGYIAQNIKRIKSHSSVFIFRNYSSDLLSHEIKEISHEINKYNPNILIFIDQEGGYVNRYIDFPSTTDIEQYFSDKYVANKMLLLSENDKIIIRGLFPRYSGYYPSLARIGKQYDSISSDESKQAYLEILSYIRLKSLSNHGINTYGLVADLNRGNPAISNNSRSFSKHLDKYKRLVDAFNLASTETGVSLYLKHFPGHGAGYVDSHVGILNLEANVDYLHENIDLFEYFLDTKKNSGGLMIAHVKFPESQGTDFTRVISKADYLLTDDLAMQGFKQICVKQGEKYSCSNSSGIFSTEKILGSDKLIKVDTKYVENVY